jgi:hypothetical protein
MRVQFKVFQSSMMSWNSLFTEVATFASAVGPTRLIGISHSEGREGLHANGVVTVWYWDEEPAKST